MTATALQVVPVQDMEVYPLGAEIRLESHFYVEFQFRRWLTSETRLLADLEVRSVVLDLFFLAQDQIPVGTLPQDERLLARMVGIEVEHFRGLCNRDPGPLNNWRPCLCGETVRLMHPVVLEMAIKALGLKRAHEARLSAGRERKRLDDLAKAMERIGATRLASIPGNVERLDEWLTEHCPGNRTERRIREGMEAVFQ